MKATLLAFFFLFTAFSVMGQTTHDITWQDGVNGTAASLEIQTGDTVRWIWGDNTPHNIVSSNSNAPADFGSETISQEGYVYSYTFNKAGNINYICDQKPDSMYGTINVVDDNLTKRSQQLDFRIYPNPVKDHIFFENNADFVNVEVTIFDVLGKVVKQEELSQSGISNGMEVSNLKRGIYLVQIDNGFSTFTQKLIKN